MSVHDGTLGKIVRFGIRTRSAPLDRARRKSLEVDDDASAIDEALPSSRTTTAIRAYLDARTAGDTQSAWDAVKDAASSWRADNSAGGVPVFSHLPLPKVLAADMARDFGKQSADAPALRELLVQLEPGLANQVKSQLESALPLGLEQRSGSTAAFHLMGGDDGGYPQPRQSPRPQQSSPPNLPPQQSPKPADTAGGDERKAECEQLKKSYVLQQRARRDAERRKAGADRLVLSLRRQREDWVNEIAAIDAALGAARSRSTDPRTQYILICPTQRGSNKTPRGPRERRAEQEKMIQEGLCETIAPITGEAGADKRRERLERAKDREIAVLQAELLSAKQELQKIDHELAQAQNEANQAARDEESYLRGLGGIFRDHEASCGDASELFPIIIE